LQIERKAHLVNPHIFQNKEEDQMSHRKSSGNPPKTKQLTASEVYQLTSHVLQEHFELDMSSSTFEASDIWDVLVAAAVQRLTIETACDLLENSPSANTVRNTLRDMLADDDNLAEIERLVNQMLVARLPKSLRKRARPCAADMTDIPYHGKHEDDDDRVRRGRAKQGTTHFHSYATLCIIRKNKRYTLAITLFRRSDSALAALKRLLDRVKTLGLRVRRLFLDRGFDNNAVADYLSQKPFPTVIPLTIRGKKGGSRALLKGRKSYQTTYTRSSQKYGEHALTVHIVCKYNKGRYRRNGVKHFAYTVIGKLKLTPQQLFEEYRRRFGIETGYRLMNTMRARTTSKCVALRLFFVALALLLLNLWHYVKWQHVFVPKPGPRQVLHNLLPLARWRLWLWEMVKQRQGFSLKIEIPLTV
jgi:putative transposase